MGLFDKVLKTVAAPFALPIESTKGLLGIQDQVGTPDLQKAVLDQGANDILSSRSIEATENPEAYTKRNIASQMAGTEAPRGLLSGGGESAFGEAIKKRQQREYDSTTNKMSREAKADAPVVQAGKIAGTTGVLRQDNTYALDFAKKTQQAQLNKKFARNNAINSILGGAGAAVGAGVGAMAGGADGARQGAALGQGVGGAAGASGGKLNYI